MHSSIMQIFTRPVPHLDECEYRNVAKTLFSLLWYTNESTVHRNWPCNLHTHCECRHLIALLFWQALYVCLEDDFKQTRFSNNLFILLTINCKKAAQCSLSLPWITSPSYKYALAYWLFSACFVFIIQRYSQILSGVINRPQTVA